MKTQKRIYRTTAFISLFLFGVIIFWSLKVSGEELTVQQKEVWKSVEAYWEYCKQGDVNALMAGFHDDYVEWWADKILPLSKEQMETHFRKWLSGSFKPIAYELEPLSINIYGDVANVFFLYKWYKGVVRTSRHGRGMQTYLKQDNKWMLIGSMEASCIKLPACK